MSKPLYPPSPIAEGGTDRSDSYFDALRKTALFRPVLGMLPFASALLPKQNPMWSAELPLWGYIPGAQIVPPDIIAKRRFDGLIPLTLASKVERPSPWNRLIGGLAP